MNSFVISKNTDDFEKIKELSFSDQDFEWNNITNNFSKLKYIKYLLDSYEFLKEKTFIDCLNFLLDDVDKMNQRYMRELTWDEEEFKDELAQIKELFGISLNLNNPLERLRTIIEAYEIFIPILEDIRNEEFVENIFDKTSLDELESFYKKRKM